ncbi:MAG: hypothetical protein OEL79_04245 [Chromatiales bacterium]|nr:hypothetical protein [Chromatiales bacterium]
MADLGKISPTKPAWSRIDETMPEDNSPHSQQHPEKDKKRDSDETTKQDKKPSSPDDDHQIDIFV